MPREPEPPRLIGLADGASQPYAILRGESGTIWVAEGEEKHGVKVLEIGINRARIEFAGQQHDLTIFNAIQKDQED